MPRIMRRLPADPELVPHVSAGLTSDESPFYEVWCFEQIQFSAAVINPLSPHLLDRGVSMTGITLTLFDISRN